MGEERRAVVFPWFAFGHMVPFLEFSKVLAQKGIHVFFISSPRNIERLPNIPRDLSTMIDLVKLSLPVVDGLPPDKEATVDLPEDKVPYLKIAYDMLESQIEKLLGQLLPDFVVHDFVSVWVPKITAKLGIPSVHFSVFSAATVAFGGSPEEIKCNKRRTRAEDFMVPPDWFDFPSKVCFIPNQAKMYFEYMKFTDQSGFSTTQRIAISLESCDVFIIKSCREIEGEYLDVIEDLIRKPVFPIGLLPPLLEEKNHSEGNSDLFDFLDKQKESSVVFVGFGSEFKMSEEEIHELALGLELSELPFVLILRKPENLSNDSDILPHGFKNRIGERGFVYFGWVSQLQILSHFAIGGCLFHSGWGTIIEALLYGHALILLPMIADQGLNAKFLVEKSLGIEVERDENGGFTKHAIAKAMRAVMVEEEGKLVKSNALKMKNIVGDRALHGSYADRFLQFMEDTKKKKPVC